MTLDQATLLALAAIGLLFAVAAFMETRGAQAARNPRLRSVAYTLALGVYCSSWTFYGAVGSAVREGWTYLPIYIAPVIVLLAAPRFLTRFAQAVAEEKAMTVSDFIAARFGHDIVVARLVTVIALLGTVPYIALQLRSIGNALALVSHEPATSPVMIAAAILLTVFAILFGAQRFEMAGRQEGLLFAIAFESLLKITALLLVAGLAVLLIARTPQVQLEGAITAFSGQFAPARLSLEFWVLCLISALAILALPRQFYMALVEAREIRPICRAPGFRLAAYIGGDGRLLVRYRLPLPASPLLGSSAAKPWTSVCADACLPLRRSKAGWWRSGAWSAGSALRPPWPSLIPSALGDDGVQRSSSSPAVLRTEAAQHQGRRHSGGGCCRCVVGSIAWMIMLLALELGDGGFAQQFACLDRSSSPSPQWPSLPRTCVLATAGRRARSDWRRGPVLLTGLTCCGSIRWPCRRSCPPGGLHMLTGRTV